MMTHACVARVHMPIALPQVSDSKRCLGGVVRVCCLQAAEGQEDHSSASLHNKGVDRHPPS